MLPQRLPDAEFEIMEYIWDATPPVTTSQAMESVGRAHGWKIQTLATLFKRLTSGDSCAQSAEREGERAFYPAISRAEYLRMETERFVGRYHKHSYASLISTLHSERLTAEDLDELSRWLREEKERGD